jgi:hypothetical protein
VINTAAEKSYENKIKRYLTEQGAWHVKFFANAYTQKGIPDILACVNGYFLAIEVKAPNGKPSELQKHHVEKINESHGCACIVYPKDFEFLKKIIESLKDDEPGYAALLCVELNKRNSHERR